MKRLTKQFLIFAFALFLPVLALGQDKVGTTGVNFLKIGPSSRGVAMADAFLGIADDASALYYNPGGLINLKKREMIFSHVDYPAGISYEFIGAVFPLKGMGAAFGLQAIALYTDDMPETTPAMPDGTGRTFTASDMAFGVSYSQRLTDKFSVGGTIKYIQENLADEVAMGWAADVGTFYDTGWKSLKIAMIITNFGPDMEFISTPFPLPIVARFAISADLMGGEVNPDSDNRLTGVIEGTHPNDNREELHLGFEYAYREMLFLRIGKKMNGFKRHSWDEFSNADNRDEYNPYLEYPIIDQDGHVSFDGFSFGGGLNVQRLGITVDYAYSNIQFLGDFHRFTLGYKFRK